VIYEMPSIGDILHFIEKFNEGKTIGSIVISPEGLYNIRKKELNKNNIDIDEELFFSEVKKIKHKILVLSKSKYKINFSSYTFYSKIAQDLTFINLLNNTLNAYGIHVDFFPRKLYNKNKWIITSIYLPFYS